MNRVPWRTLSAWREAGVFTSRPHTPTSVQQASVGGPEREFCITLLISWVTLGKVILSV